MKKDPSGQRSVEAEVEVPGTPEEVWEAIATGPGISSWFVPSTSEARVGGTATSNFGPGMESVATITQWSPPNRFVAETEEEPGRVATEWHVEARDGGTCVVRVVHRWFASTDEWDGQFEGHAYGWATSFFPMLRLYLSHFPGQRCSAFQLTALSGKSALETLRTSKGAMGIDDESGKLTSTPEAPQLAGVLERVEITDPELLRIGERAPRVVAALERMEGEEPELFLRLDRPAPGLAHMMVVAMGDQTLVSMRFHLYGDADPAVVEVAEHEWQAWLDERFPQEASQ